MGGTWDLFRYPGIRPTATCIRCTLKPWREAKAIADGPSILNYVKETAAEYGVDEHIRYQHLATKAAWSSRMPPDHRSAAPGHRQTVRFTCGLHVLGLLSSGGLHAQSRTSAVRGTIVHPAVARPDYKGKRVVVIGPRNGDDARSCAVEGRRPHRHAAAVAELRRVASRQGCDRERVAHMLPDRWAYAITRWKNVAMQQFLSPHAHASRKVKQKLLDMVRKELGPDTTSRPTSRQLQSGDQRLCLVPNGDLFEAIQSGQASIVTDHTPASPKPASSSNPASARRRHHRDRDGLSLVVLGEVQFAVDGTPVDFAQT
jgi:cation diffusion facilitator CzcD-associated flavoprotein CzcO